MGNFGRRTEGSSCSLDLNNLPDDYMTGGGRDQMGQQQMAVVVLLDDTSTSVGGGGGGGNGGAGGGGSSSSGKKKRSSGKDESGKVYECRFCSLKFCKSQALGGHMNRHRQERETEVLNRAREIVYSNESAYGNLPPPPLPYISPAVGGYHHHHHQAVYPTGLFTGSSSSPSSSILPSSRQPPSNNYLYSTSPMAPARLVPYPPNAPHPQTHDYFVGHAVPITTNGSSASHFGHHMPPLAAAGAMNYGGGRAGGGSGYTCVGAPVRFMANHDSGSDCRLGTRTAGGSSTSREDGSLDQDGANWADPRPRGGVHGGGGGGHGYVGTSAGQRQQQRMDSSSSINRYHHHQQQQQRHHGSF